MDSIVDNYGHKWRYSNLFSWDAPWQKIENIIEKDMCSCADADSLFGLRFA
jgi:hypothetical protein